MIQKKIPDGSNLSEAELGRLVGMLKTQAHAVATKIPLLGSIAWLMMQQSSTKHTFLAELEWRVMPPLLLDQAKLYVRDEMPLAFVSWARLSEDAVARYASPPHRLAPPDWHSGEQVWLVDMFTPYGGSAEVLDDLRTKVFPGKTLFQLGPMEGDVAKVLRWDAVLET